MCILPSAPSNSAAEQARRDQEAREGRIREGTTQIDQTFSQFGDDYFNQRSQAFLDYGMPQLEDQYAQAQKDLTFALARGGNLNSSTAAEKRSKLKGEYDRNLLSINDQAGSYANEARANTEGARSDLVSQLNATGDVDAIGSAALTRAKLLSAPAAFNPLGQLFTNLAATASTTPDDRRTATGGVRLFGGSSGSNSSRGSARVVA